MNAILAKPQLFETQDSQNKVLTVPTVPVISASKLTSR